MEKLAFYMGAFIYKKDLAKTMPERFSSQEAEKIGSFIYNFSVSKMDNMFKDTTFAYLYYVYSLNNNNSSLY